METCPIDVQTGITANRFYGSITFYFLKILFFWGEFLLGFLVVVGFFSVFFGGGGDKVLQYIQDFKNIRLQIS